MPADPSPSGRRARTRQAMLDVLQKSGDLTRAELSAATGLSRSAVADCVAGLVDEGLVTEVVLPRPVPGRGRPRVALRLRRPDGAVLGIDLGHAHVAAAVATTQGEVLVECSGELDVDHRPHHALDLAADLARQALTRSDRTIGDVRAVSAGIPGPLDMRTQVVRAPTILADWVDLDPAAELTRRIGRPTVVGNDADMGAAGERAFGVAREFRDFLYIKASHGVGAGIVLDGRTYRGATGIAGEIGHTQIVGAGNWCRCGSRGCLETVVSIGEVRRQLAHVLSTSGAVVDETTGVPPLEQLRHNSSAARVITDAGRTIGRVVADLVNLLNPGAIVLGGELGAAGEPFVSGVRESVDRYAQPASAQVVQVVAGVLGARAELLGTIATSLGRLDTPQLRI